MLTEKELQLAEKYTQSALEADAFLLKEIEKVDSKHSEMHEKMIEEIDTLKKEPPMEQMVERVALRVTSKNAINAEDVKQELLPIIKDLIPPPIKGDKGDSYILTDKDKKEIVGKIEIPVIEKIIEIQNQPIITNEVKEVAIKDTSEQVRDKIESLTKGNKLSIQSIEDLSDQLEQLKTEIHGKANISTVSASLISKRIRFVDDETPSGTVDGVNAVFTISRAPETGSLKVYVNGQRMRITEDYAFSGKTITFIIAPPTGSIILVDFRY